MKYFILLALLIALTQALEGITHGAFSVHEKRDVCHQNRPHQLSIDATSVNGTFIDLNSVKHLELVHCNTKGNKIALVFLWPTYESDFKHELENGALYHTFITGSGHKTCGHHPIMKRVISWNTVAGFGLEVELSDAKYDQVFESAHLTMAPSTTSTVCKSSSAQPAVDSHVCLGYNTQTCSGAENPIQVWQNTYFDVVCSNCYVGLNTDVFFDVTIDDFSLTNMSAGFKNAQILGALEVDFVAQADWSSGVNKDYPIASTTNVFDFFIGPVPFHLYFEIPLNLQAMAQFNSKASVIIGASFEMNVGDLYVEWGSGRGWNAVVGTPTFSWTPQITDPTASFDAHSSLSLVPSFIAHFDELFTTTTTLTPVLTAQAQGSGTVGSGAQVCASMAYNVQAETSADLQISIPWADINSDHHWSKTLINTGTVQIGKICANVSLGAPPRTYAETIKPIESREIPLNEPMAAQPKDLAALVTQQQFSSKGQSKKTSAGMPKALVKGFQPMCMFGKPHALSYQGTVSGTFVKLEQVLGVTGVSCNIDTTRVIVHFQDTQSAGLFATKNLTVWSTFLTCGEKFKCDNGNMFRRVLSWSVQGNTVQVKTQNGQYSEVFNDMSISFGPSASSAAVCDAQDDYEVCLPVNANSNCTAAKGPISIYQNEYISLTCSNCFLGIKMDVFFDIKMAGFALEEFQGGFQNINVFGGLVVDWQASKSWSAGVDREFPLISPTTILDLWIGSIPLTINLAAPVEVKMNADFDTTASATIGATADLSLGSASVHWKWDQGWSHTSPSPSLAWTPLVTAPHGSLTASANFALIPRWTLHVDGFYQLEMEFNPSLNMNAQGQASSFSRNSPNKTGAEVAALHNAKDAGVTAGVCAVLTDTVELSVTSDLEIAIPWVSLQYNFDYGPKELYNSGTQTIGKKCVSV